MPFIGVALGVYLSMAAFDREVAAQLAQSPEAGVCGNPGIFFLFYGFVAGSLGGAIAGAAIAKLVTWLMRGRGPQDAFEEVSGCESVPTDNLIAKESKDEALRAEIALVNRMVTQAENECDEEVLRKLTDYKTTLQRAWKVARES